MMLNVRPRLQAGVIFSDEGLKSIEIHRGFPFCWTDMRIMTTGKNCIYAAHCSTNCQAFQKTVTSTELSFILQDLLTGTSNKCLFQQFWI